MRFVKRAQGLGVSLDEIAVLLALRQIKSPRPRVQEITTERIEAIEGKIAQLQAMKKALTTLLDTCRHGRAATCPILEALDGEPGTAPPKSERRVR